MQVQKKGASWQRPNPCQVALAKHAVLYVQRATYEKRIRDVKLIASRVVPGPRKETERATFRRECRHRKVVWWEGGDYQGPGCRGSDTRNKLSVYSNVAFACLRLRRRHATYGRKFRMRNSYGVLDRRTVTSVLVGTKLE